MADAVNATINATSVVQSTADQLHLAFKDLLQNSGQPFFQQLTQNNIMFFFVMVLAAFIISYGFVLICKIVIKAITSRTETDLDDILLEKLQHPVAMSIFLLLLSVALVPLSLGSKLASLANILLISCNIFLLGTIANRIISVVFLHFGQKITANTESTVDDHLLPIIKKIITAIVYIITFLFIFSLWGIQIAPLLAGAGIAGLALAFSMQESLKNIFGGVSLAFDKAYGIGDRIKLADGTVGTVTDISLRSTKIKTFTGDLITVPNGKISNENFQSYAQPTPATLVVVPFSVAYGTDVETVKKIGFSVVKGTPGVFESKKEDKETVCEFLEMGQYSLNFRVAFWVADYKNSWEAKLAATDKLYAALIKNKIDIPYPTQAVVLKK